MKSRFQPRIAFGCVVAIAACAALLYFGGDRRAAGIVAGEACLGLFLTYGALQRARKAVVATQG